MITALIGFAGKLWPPLLAVILTQRFIEMRKPMLKLSPEGVKALSLKQFVNGVMVSEEPYHTWRFKVENIKIPWYVRWIIWNRDNALRCAADLTFYSFEGKELFKMQGRWANTVEISYLTPGQQEDKMIYPEKMDIECGEYQPLDCIIKYDGEKEAYGWNNESYSSVPVGKNSRCMLKAGKYNIGVRLSGQNFKQVKKKFNIVIAEDWQETSLT